MMPAVRFRWFPLLWAWLAGAGVQAGVIDGFLYLPDVQGEVRDAAHNRWIGIQSFSHAIQGIEPVWTAGSGHGRAAQGELVLEKNYDSSSPKLALICSTGLRMDSATLEWTRTLRDSSRYYWIKLAEVNVTSIAYSGQTGEGSLRETVTLSYKGIEWSYTPVGPDEKPLADLFAWWNVLANLGDDSAVECLTASPSVIQDKAGSQPTLTLTIPPLLNVSGTVGVRLTSSDPKVVTFPNATDGSVLVPFADGTPPAKDVKLLLLRPGQATITMSRSGACAANSVAVTVTGSLIRNPSFELNYPDSWPHYGPIDSWTGGEWTGVNRANDPFQDNGAVPDRAQVAFIQGSLALGQDLTGLDPARSYWLQFRYNARNCCGGTIGFKVTFAGQQIAAFPAVAPVGNGNPYASAQVAFQPSAASGRLEFRAEVAGDASLLIDAVSLVQRDPDEIVLRNPSFEASGIPASPGYLQPGPMEGWDGTGNYGVNLAGEGPFADNGLAPDQAAVALLQNAGSSLGQAIGGLVPGDGYTVTFAVNARAGNTPRLRVKFDSQILSEEDITPVGGANPYAVKQAVFRAAANTGRLVFEQTAAGDNTVLLDDVHVRHGVPPGWQPTLKWNLTATGIRVAWSRSFVGFRLQSTTHLDGGWADHPLPPAEEAGEFAVYLGANAAVRFFRLRQ